MADIVQKGIATGEAEELSLDTKTSVSSESISAAAPSGASTAPESSSSDFYDNLAERFFDFLFFESLIP